MDVGKTRDKDWSSALRKADFHQFLDIHKDNQVKCWGFKIRGWGRKGDIRTTKTRKSRFESRLGENYLGCTNRSPGVRVVLTEVILVPQRNVGKYAYTVDLEINEKLYWLVTESGLLGSVDLRGHSRWGSCDTPTRSMGSVFCNFSGMQWNTTDPLPHQILQEQRTRESSKVDREEEGLISSRPQLAFSSRMLGST